MLRKQLRFIPFSVLMLGLVSLLMDLSSEMIHALLPLFMVNQLGLSLIAVGALDGIAEALTLWCKPLSGWLSDRQQKRKPLTVLGYGLAALAKPLFALASGLGLIIVARLIDRVGKGIRGAPRDALIADITPAEHRGAAYGLRQSLDTIGAVLAPVVASLLLLGLALDYRTVFWIACVPAWLAVVVLIVGVRESSPVHHAHKPKPNGATSVRQLWPLFVLAFILMLARPAESFLILRAQDTGFSAASAPLILAAMNVVYALSAWPFGIAFDRIGEQRLLILSLLLLISALLCLGVATTPFLSLLGAGLWGLHLGSSQGLLSALIAHHAPSAKRGRSFGVYAFCCGIALLLNGVAFGALWQHQSAQFAFTSNAAITAVVLLCSIPLLQRLRRGLA